MNQPTFSVILPFYRQQKYIDDTIKKFQFQLDRMAETYEIIAVNNGVANLTSETAVTTVNQNPLIIRLDLKQAGWGRAVKAGLARAQGKFICYTNTARTNPDELAALLKYAKISEDKIIKALRVERTTQWRRWVSIFFNLEYKLILKTPIWDVNATPKIIPKKILDKITLFSDGDMIDGELMHKCFLASIPIIEIPVKHLEPQGWKSTTNIYSALKMFWGILELRFKNHHEKK